MDWTWIYSVMSALWVVWFMALFVAIVIWAFRPSRRRTMEEHGHIPLRDGEP